MNISECRILITAAEEMSFSRTAARLYVSQSVISKTVKKLETELNTVIFSRSSRTVSLTPEGRRVIDAAENMVQIYDALNQSLHQNPSLAAKPLSIWYSQMAEYLMTGIFNDLVAAIDGLMLQVSCTPSEEKKNYDLVLIPEELSSSLYFTGYQKRPLIRSELCLAVSATHRLARLSSAALSRLQGMTLILLESRSPISLNDRILKLLKDRKIEVHRLLYADNLNEIYKKLSMMENTCALIPGLARGHAFSGITFLPLEDCSLNTDLICLAKCDPSNPVIEQAADLIQKQFARLETSEQD